MHLVYFIPAPEINNNQIMTQGAIQVLGIFVEDNVNITEALAINMVRQRSGDVQASHPFEVPNVGLYLVKENNDTFVVHDNQVQKDTITGWFGGTSYVYEMNDVVIGRVMAVRDDGLAQNVVTPDLTRLPFVPVLPTLPLPPSPPTTFGYPVKSAALIAELNMILKKRTSEFGDDSDVDDETRSESN